MIWPLPVSHAVPPCPALCVPPVAENTLMAEPQAESVGGAAAPQPSLESPLDVALLERCAAAGFPHLFVYPGAGCYGAEMGSHAGRALAASQLRRKAVTKALRRAEKKATSNAAAAAAAPASAPLRALDEAKLLLALSLAAEGEGEAEAEPLLPPLGLLDKDDDGDEALSLEALLELLAARAAADATAPLPPSEPREASRPACPICACVSSCVLFDRTTEAAGSVM